MDTRTEAICDLCGEKIVRDNKDQWIHEHEAEVFFTWAEHEAAPRSEYK